MYVTIDDAGRIVIPKVVRERSGLYAGVPIAVSVDDDGIRLTPEFPPQRLERRGRLLVAVSPDGASIDDAAVEGLREEIVAERERQALGGDAD